MSKARTPMTLLGAALLLWFCSWALQAEQAPPAPAAETSFVSRPLADFQLMLDRPLFNANRKPLEDEVADSGETSLDEQQLREAWRLTGIVLEPDRQLALFSQRNDSLHLQLEVGMMLANDWVLARIAEDHAELQRGDRRIEIVLHDPKNLPPAPQPAPSDTPATQPAKPAQEKAKSAEQKAKAAPAANGKAQPASPPKQG